MANIEPIAVIGIGCRCPGGVGSPEELWNLLSEGRTGLSEIPADRWNANSFYQPDPEAREALNTKKGYFLQQDVTEFDARFFGFVIIVTAVGSEHVVQNTYKFGDRVIGLLGPAYSSYTRIKWLQCQKLPDTVGLIEGASIHPGGHLQEELPEHGSIR